jgi:hypothetical protein
MGFINEINYHTLQQRIGSQNIFEHYFGPFSLTQAYHSPLRKDARKSVGFFITKSGEVIYNDFAENRKLNFVQFVAALRNITEIQAMEHIAQQFGLLKGAAKVVAIKPIKPLKKPPKKAITVQTRPFTQRDYIYWLKYNISLKQLKKHNIYSVSKFSIGDYSTYINRDQLCYAYLLFDDNGNGYFKIYQPENPDKKWMYNGALHLIYGLNQLPFESNTLIITKSVKDFLLLKQFFPDVIALQNESSSAAKKEVLSALKKCYKNIIIWMDADRPGIRAANYYKKTWGFTPFFINFANKNIFYTIRKVKQLKVKDPSDFVAKYGINKFFKFLKQNNFALRT